MTPQQRLCLGACAFGRALDAVENHSTANRRYAAAACLWNCVRRGPTNAPPIGEPLWTGIRVIDGLLTMAAVPGSGFSVRPAPEKRRC